MAASAIVQITGRIVGSPTGGKTFGPLTITSSAANAQTQEVALAAGDTTVTVPTNPAPSGCLITLPSSNTSVVTLKGAAADTGIIIGKASTTQVLNWLASVSAPTSFILNAATSPAPAGVAEVSFF